MSVFWDTPGKDEVVIYIAATKQMKTLSGDKRVDGTDLLEYLKGRYGEENIKLV